MENDRAIKEILSSPEYFTCEKLSARMKITACKKRRSKGIYPTFVGRYIPHECRKCEQGEKYGANKSSKAGILGR